jgi:flagellar hook-length control protein FliK
VTATAPIATNTAPANDTGTASRAKNTSADDHGTFDALVGKSHDDAKDAQTDTSKSDSAPAKPSTANEKAHAPKKAVETAPKGKLTDQALLAQLKLLGGKDAKAGKADAADADDNTQLQPRAKAKTKNADTAAVPTNTILQQLLAKTPAQDQIKLAAANRKTQPVLPKDAGEDAVPAAPKDGKDAAEQLKTLSNPADAAKQQSAPAQNTVAKALNLHFDAANANGNKDQHTGDQKQGDQQNRSAKTAPDATPSPDLKQAAALPMAPQAPAHTQGQTQPAQQQQTADALAAATPAQATTQTAQPVSASLHVAPQSADVAPNLVSLAVNIVAKSKDGKKDFDIRLDPAELGRVDVKLSIDDAGKTQATLQAEKPHTLELMQRDRGTLERALRDAGLDLAGGGLNFSLKGQDRDANSGTPAGRGRNLSVSAIADSASAASLAATQISPADSRLDIRV